MLKPTSTSSATPAQRSTSLGSPRALSTTVPSSVTSVKLSAMPLATSHGRRRVSALTASTIGSTGRMHGDSPVTSPPISPISATSQAMFPSLFLFCSTPPRARGQRPLCEELRSSGADWIGRKFLEEVPIRMRGVLRMYQ